MGKLETLSPEQRELYEQAVNEFMESLTSIGVNDKNLYQPASLVDFDKIGVEILQNQGKKQWEINEFLRDLKYIWGCMQTEFYAELQKVLIPKIPSLTFKIVDPITYRCYEAQFKEIIGNEAVFYLINSDGLIEKQLAIGVSVREINIVQTVMEE